MGKNTSNPNLPHLVAPVSDLDMNIGKVGYSYKSRRITGKYGKDEWVSTNETIEKIFSIINNQMIPTKVSPDTFTFPKTKECGLYNREVKIRQITISGKNTLKGDFSGSISSIILGVGDFQSEVNINGALPSDLIQKMNNEKNTTLTGKTFKYESSGWWSSYKCETSPNISFIFFSE